MRSALSFADNVARLNGRAPLHADLVFLQRRIYFGPIVPFYVRDHDGANRPPPPPVVWSGGTLELQATTSRETVRTPFDAFDASALSCSAVDPQNDRTRLIRRAPALRTRRFLQPLSLFFFESTESGQAFVHQASPDPFSIIKELLNHPRAVQVFRSILASIAWMMLSSRTKCH